MAKWYYYNEVGEKISVTDKELKSLASSGQITPDTLIEAEDGKTAPAGKVHGLKFLNGGTSKPIPPLPNTATGTTNGIETLEDKDF